MNSTSSVRDRLASRALVAALGVMLAAAAGCGGSSPAASVAASKASMSQAAQTSGTETPGTEAAASGGAAGDGQAAASAGQTAGSAATTSAKTPVKATGGGDFCKAIAASLNKQAAAGTSSQEIAGRVATIRKEEEQAASLAPASIKADVVRLLAASDAVWTALAKVNYDYSQLKASDMSALASPETAAAEARVTAYMTGTCGISVGAPPAKPSH